MKRGVHINLTWRLQSRPKELHSAPRTEDSTREAGERSAGSSELEEQHGGAKQSRVDLGVKTQGPGNSELCPTEGARQRTSPSRPTSSLAQELLTWRHGAAACTAAGAAAATSPERPWPCGLCAGQVRLAPAQAKLLCLRPRGGTRRAGARRRVERAREED